MRKFRPRICEKSRKKPGTKKAACRIPKSLRTADGPILYSDLYYTVVYLIQIP